MLRTVTAVTLAVAILAVSLPVAEAAADDRAAGRLRQGLTALGQAAGRLVATTDPVAPSSSGARTTVSLSVPEDRLVGSGGTVIVGDCPTATALCFRVGAGPARGVGTPVALRATAGSLRLPPGRHRLGLRHVRSASGTTVLLTEV